MKQAIFTGSAQLNRSWQLAATSDNRPPLVTRFGDAIDVRNRGTLRVRRIAGTQAEMQDAPAVVRIWTDEQCREITSHQARALAAQLLAAATLTDAQNNH